MSVLKFDRKEKENLNYLVNMAENEVWEPQNVIEEDDEHFDPLLDNVNMATHMEEDVDSESWSQNGLRGVGVEDPSHEKKGTMATRERPGTQRKCIVADVRATNKRFL